MTAEDVKTALSGSLPEIVTHELKNGSIKAVMKSDNADNEKAALEALAEMTFYTVNYTTKVTDETGAEDDSLGTITITQYDGKDLEKKELRYDGSTAYVAKAGDKILIDVKVKNGYVDKDREEKVTGTSEVKTEETDTEIITTTTTPVTRKTWTERTAYELDLDKLKIVDELGYDATVKLVKETSTAGGVTWSLEVTPVGSIDLDIEAIIKAITSEINLQEITENIVKVDKKAKEVKPEEEHKAAPDNNSKYHEAPKELEEWTEGWIKDQKGWRYIVGKDEYFKGSWGYFPWNDFNYWYYFDKDGYVLTGWQYIGEKWYYLEPEEGKNLGHMWADTVTPDGHRLDETGARID